MLLDWLHIVLLLAALFLVAAAGRRLARLLRLPSVIGEIALSLLIGPILLASAGTQVFEAVLPQSATAVLKQIGDAGLVLFLVGVVHHLDRGSGGLRSTAVGRITLGALVIPLATGLVFAGWVLGLAPPQLRGDAPAPALVLTLAVAMSVTAVPVLARIIEERKSSLGRAGELSMIASMLIDTLAWLLLAVALGLAAGGLDGVLRAFAAIAVGGVSAYAAHRCLATLPVTRRSSTNPRAVAVGLGVLALAAGAAAHAVGLTAILGAFLVGLMIPATESWSTVVALISRVGRVLVPVFFVVAGTTLTTSGGAGLPWLAVLLATGLGIVGKVAGGYLGARWGGEDVVTSVRVGVLVNTRGLTEIVVLQVSYNAGLLTAGLFVALLVMALVTTALTGPLLDLVDRDLARRKPLLQREV